MLSSRWSRFWRRGARRQCLAHGLLSTLGVLCLSGCGASTLRLAVGPEMDAKGNGGFEVMLGLGIGTPLDFIGRSHHFLQIHGDLGGGGTGKNLAGQFTALGGGDYIYWAEPLVTMRTGVLFQYRAVWESESSALDLTGVGGHAAILPVVKLYDGGPMLMMLQLGPDIRMMQLWGSGPSTSGPVFSVPLSFEVNVFAVGD